MYIKFLVTLIISPILLVSSFSYADQQLLAYPSSNYLEQYQIMKQVSPAFSDLIKIVRNAEPQFAIEARECGVINAWYSPATKKITLCYEYLQDGDNFIERQFSNQPIQIQANLKTGILMALLMHELGHAIIDIKNISVLGNQEDAADRISTIFLLEYTKNQPILGKLAITGDLAYKQATIISASDKLSYGMRLYADEHPLNEQRIFNIICLAYGSNPSLFLDTALQLHLPKERAIRCEEEFADSKSAIMKLVN